MSTWLARRTKPESTLQKRATVLLISPTPQAWRRSQTPCPSHGLDQWRRSMAGLILDKSNSRAALVVRRLSQACERWIYTACLCFALDLDEQKRSGFHYQYSNYQVEYSRNLIFEIGGHMDQVFQALIDRSRVLAGSENSQNDSGLQAPPDISQAEVSRMGSSGRETCV